jgi:hypothetical protein
VTPAVATVVTSSLDYVRQVVAPAGVAQPDCGLYSFGIFFFLGVSMQSNTEAGVCNECNFRTSRKRISVLDAHYEFIMQLAVKRLHNRKAFSYARIAQLLSYRTGKLLKRSTIFRYFRKRGFA